MKKAFVSGNFNIVHPGHLRLLKYAREISDYLVVAVRSDRLAGREVILPEDLRMEAIEAINFVDEVVLLDREVEFLLNKISPNFVVKGSEFQGRFNIEDEILKKIGGELVFCSGETKYSGIEMLSRDGVGVSTTPYLLMPSEFMVRHSIGPSDLLKTIEEFPKIKVAVVGDLIIDEYISCTALGMSQEDPALVVAPIESIKYLGGAGIVAGHAAGLGSHVNFVSIVGSDENGAFAKKMLDKYSVASTLIIDSTRPTILKQRYRSKGKTLLRVNHIRQAPVSEGIHQKLMESLEKIIPTVKLLVFSDFNYGCLPQTLVEKISKLADRYGVMVVADSQSSSQIGDIGRYKNVKLLTPTEREARLSTKNYSNGLVELAKELMIQTGAEYVFLKMNSDGALITSKLNEDTPEWHTDQIQALNRYPKDVSGAGDSMLIASALALAGGSDIWGAALIGSIAAGIQVGRIGNIPITVDEIKSEIAS